MPAARMGLLKSVKIGGLNPIAPIRNRPTSRSAPRPGLRIVVSFCAGGLGPRRAPRFSPINLRLAAAARATPPTASGGTRLQDLSHLGHQLARREGLGDVVVGAERQALLALDVAAARGQHDDLNVLPARIGAHALAH